MRKTVRDHIRNGLALAGAGRPEEHEVLAALRRDDRRDLRRIRRQRREEISRVDRLVEASGFDEVGRAAFVGVGGRIDQVADDGIALEIVGPIDEILPHQIFREGEGCEHDLFGNLPALDAFHMLAHDLPDARDVDAGAVRGKLAFEFRHRQAEVPAQHLEQRRIEPHLVLVQRQPETGAHALPFKLHRNHEERRAIRAGAVLGRPLQKPEAEIKDVRAALFEGEARRPIQVCETSLHFSLGRLGVQFVAAHGLEHIGLAPVLVLAFAEERRIASVAPVEDCGPTLHLEALARGEQVFELRRIGAFDRDRRLVLLEVEQAVAQREIEQAALPGLEAVERPFGRGCAAVQFLLEHRSRFEFVGLRRRRLGIDRGGRRSSEIKRPDPGCPGSLHVDREFERGLCVLGDVVRPLSDRLLESGGMLPGQGGGFDEDHLVELNALSQHLRVVDNWRREVLVHEPDACEGVVRGEDDEGIQPGLFEARGIEERQVKARADLAR